MVRTLQSSRFVSSKIDINISSIVVRMCFFYIRFLHAFLVDTHVCQNMLFLCYFPFQGQNTEVIAPLFDACASWWTQGPDATLQVILMCSVKLLILLFQTYNNHIGCLINRYTLKYAIAHFVYHRYAAKCFLVTNSF